MCSLLAPPCPLLAFQNSSNLKPAGGAGLMRGDEEGGLQGCPRGGSSQHRRQGQAC